MNWTFRNAIMGAAIFALYLAARGLAWLWTKSQGLPFDW